MTTIKNKQQLLTHPEAHPIALDVWLMSLYGPDFVLWEPETLWRELYLDIGVNPSDVNKNKIQALRTVHAQTTPFDMWEIFLPVTLALDNIVPRFDVMQPPSIPTLLASVDTMRTVRADPPLGREVLLFCQAIFLHAGVMCAPPPLEALNDLLPATEKEDRAIMAAAKGGAQLNNEESPIEVQASKLRAYMEYLNASRRRAVAHMKIVRDA